ncbi:MAG: hypothetical protein EOP04_10570 [Proteobacteria bacterium]|nr:MAG: hypothetical protein EOP04_10570 [Pseudomonadota bacterium]
MISYAAPVIARVASQALNEILKLLTFQEHVKFGLGPVDWALGAVEDIFEIIIPDSVREKIVKQFENFIADTIREFIKVGTIPFDIVTTAVDRILDFFPDELGKNSWKTVLLGAISDIMPWLSFEAIWELLILIAGIEALKYPTMPESNIAFLMWSYTAVCETRPDYAAILHPILDEFFKFLRGNDNANGTWAWLAGDGGRVADEINLFETHNLRNWESFAFGSTKFGEWERKIPKILKERPGVPPITFEKEFPRIDYLVLHGLREKGPPKLLTTTIGNWFNNFLNFAKEALKKFIEWLKRKFNEGLKFVQEVLAEGYRVVKKIYEKVTTALGDTYQYAEEIFMNGVRVARKLYDQFGNVLENFYEDAGRFVEEVWDSAGNFISKGIFRAGSMIERTFMKEGQKVIDAWRTGVADFSRQIFNSSGLKTFEAIARGVFSEEIFTSIGSLLKTVWKFAPNYLSIGSVDLNAAISRLENWGSSVVNHTWNETLNGIKYIGEQLWEGVKVFTRTAETLANGLYQEVVIPFSKSLREVTKWWANEAGKAIDMVKRQVLEPTGQVIDEVWTWTGAKVDQYTKEVWKDMSRFTKQSIETITIGLSYTVKLFNDAGREISRLIADGVGRIIEATGVFVNKTADAIGDILTGLNPAHWDVDFGIDIPLPWSL